MTGEHNHENHHHHDDPNQSLFKKLLSKVFHSHDHDIKFDPQESTQEGIRAVKISFIGLMITGILQIFVVVYTNSVALFADTVHNFSDAFTSIPLWIAFIIGRRGQNSKYTYGYGKAEDLAGLVIVFMIAASAIIVFVESFNRLVNPMAAENLLVLSMAAIIGFIGNEIVARYRINVGRSIGSESLIADGLHSRTDAWVSLSVLVGAIGTYIGFPILDPIVGLFIGFLILIILKDATSRILMRLMDAVDPDIIQTIEQETVGIRGVEHIEDIKARWMGRSLFAELQIVVNRDYTVAESYNIEESIEERLVEKIPPLTHIVVKDRPCNHHISN